MRRLITASAVLMCSTAVAQESTSTNEPKWGVGIGLHSLNGYVRMPTFPSWSLMYDLYGLDIGVRGGFGPGRYALEALIDIEPVPGLSAYFNYGSEAVIVSEYDVRSVGLDYRLPSNKPLGKPLYIRVEATWEEPAFAEDSPRWTSNIGFGVRSN